MFFSNNLRLPLRAAVFVSTYRTLILVNHHKNDIIIDGKARLITSSTEPTVFRKES